ncbi:DUF6517 family protein [Halopiger djelfimassiliensis]|uniref:DUF6517 family protein n=1 Tax=Halopiger djelfimassiliensis TaxID=1293047 RepID=UPI00067791BF|nr:DUF6517 family protein [Halopiger djelfimassiliensis]
MATPSRRTLLAAGATGTLALTAGCLDFVLGKGPLEFDSSRVAPTETALTETEYENQTVEEETIEETIDVGVEREIRASLWRSHYSKEIEYQGRTHEGALFAAVSVPAMEVLGRSFNPLDDMSNEELLERLLSEVDGEQGNVENIRHDESFGLEILGEGREVDRFVGQSEFDGEPIDVELTLTAVSHADDLLVLLGSYPRNFAEEAVNVELLMESVEHPV